MKLIKLNENSELKKSKKHASILHEHLETTTLKVLPNCDRKLLNLHIFFRERIYVFFHTIFLGKYAIISIVFNQILAFLVRIFSKLYENVFIISQNFLQDNILGVSGNP